METLTLYLFWNFVNTVENQVQVQVKWARSQWPSVIHKLTWTWFVHWDWKFSILTISMLLLKRLDKSVIIWGTTTGTTFSRVVLYYLSHPLWSRSPNLLILNGSSSDLERIGWDQSRLPWEMGLRIEDVEVDDVTPSLDSARFELLSAENRQQNWKRRGQETGDRRGGGGGGGEESRYSRSRLHRIARRHRVARGNHR